MAKLSEDKLKKRKAELGRQAREELAKTEIMRFRLEPHNISHLCELAELRRQRVGTMVRQWVLERLEAEILFARKKPRVSSVPIVAESGGRYLGALQTGNRNTFDIILLRLAQLEATVKRLSKHSNLSHH